MKTDFWDKHYSSFKTLQPSPFAEYCANHFLKPDDLVVEIGCGNGRDAQYIMPRVGDYYGIDACPKAAEVCRKSIAHFDETGVLSSRVLTTDASAFDYASIVVPGRRTVVYSRFSIHSMDYKEEKRLLEALAAIPGPKVLLVEVRTIFDPHYNVGTSLGQHEFQSDHYRRFLDPAKFINDFSVIGLPVFVRIASGQAAFGNEDPIVLRAVFDSSLMDVRNRICDSADAK